MKKSKIAVCLSVAALMGTLLTPALSLAAFKQQNMPVQAQVNANCNFTSSNTMSFVGYDPAGANATADLGGTVVVDVRCTRGATVRIGIDTGANPGAVGGSTRAMRLGATANYLGYDFYQDAAYGTLWTNSAPGWYSFVSPSNAPNTITMHGRVPGGQDVPAGLYQDTVVVTVNY
jgi:spore coat protein U-like protein